MSPLACACPYWRAYASRNARRTSSGLARRAGEIDGELEALARVAHVERVREANIEHLFAARLHLLAVGTLLLAERRDDGIEIEVRKRRQEGAHMLAPLVGDQQSEGRQVAGIERHEYPPHAELGRRSPRRSSGPRTAARFLRQLTGDSIVVAHHRDCGRLGQVRERAVTTPCPGMPFRERNQFQAHHPRAPPRPHRRIRLPILPPGPTLLRRPQPLPDIERTCHDGRLDLFEDADVPF